MEGRRNRIGLHRECKTCTYIRIEGNDPVCGLGHEVFSRKVCNDASATDHPAIAGHKCCCSCRKVYRVEDFYPINHGDGRDNYCKWCKKMIRIESDNRREALMSAEELEARRLRHNLLNRGWVERQKMKQLNK